jgi:aryl-alcohol dehydrogenase-like predicted oxidoreductase
MDRKPLFTDGPAVSRLCLGTMMFGNQADEAQSARILEAFFAAGGNFIDTADAYVGGVSEEIIGRNLGSRRADCFLATKVGNPVEGVKGSGGLSPGWVMQAAAMSVERLRSDVIDLYYLHADDNQTSLDETIGALGDLIAAGTVRYWGFSNFRPWKIAEMVRIADRLGVARPAACQPYYHMLNRTAESDTLPACRHFGFGVIPYSPLGRGILTGKYRHGTPQGSRGARGDKRFMEAEFHPETMAQAAKMADYADKKSRDPVSLAINWVLANDAVTSVLIGPKSFDQLQAYLAAPAEKYDAADEALLSSLCAPGHTPAPSHSDPRYPLRGRWTAFDGGKTL